MIPDEAIVKAKELASGLSQRQRYRAITDYAEHNFVYDYVKAFTVKRYGVQPDPEGCWEKHMGICGDLAALIVGMLKAVGIDAQYVVGKADGIHHAWVKTSYGIYDPVAEITGKTPKKYKERT